MNSKKSITIIENDGYVPNGGAQTMDLMKYGDEIDPLFVQEQTFGSDNENVDDAAEDSDGDIRNRREANTKWPQMEQLLKHVCAKCGMEFGKETFLEQHLDNLHSELHLAKNLKITVTSPTEGICQICGAHIKHSMLRDLHAHYFMHLPYNSYKCKCHNYSFHDKQTAFKHLRLHAQQGMSRKEVQPKPSQQTAESIPFEGCRKFEDGTAYDPQYPETAVRYMCPECGQNFIIEDEWKEHCSSEHDFKTMKGLNMTKLEGDQVRCNECNTTITSKSDNYKLRRHKVTHSPFKAYHCKLCIYARKRKEDVLQHIRHTHVRIGEKYY